MTETVEVVIGRIGRAHGIKGEVAVEPRTDEPKRRFARGAVVRGESDGRQLTVVESRWHSGRLLVHFAEAVDRSTAEALRGIVVVTDVPSKQRPGAAEEYYDRQLVGLGVFDHTGQRAGEVVAIQHGAAQDLLQVRTVGGESRLVPFVEALVPEVDLAAGSLTLADLPGLLEDLDDDK